MFAFSCLASQTLGQSARSIGQISKLLADYHDAREGIRGDKLFSLLDEGFKETVSSGNETKSFTKPQLAASLKEIDPALVRKVQSVVVNENEISSLVVTGHDRKTANLSYKLIVRKHYEDPETTEKFKFVERFEITGTAVRSGGKWKVASLNKNALRNPSTNFDGESIENMNFAFALMSLVLAENKKTSSADPRH
jgi:hypothetical protein